MYQFLIEKRKTNRLTLDIALICISLFWISRGKYLIALLLIVVALAGFYINRKKIVTVSDEGIRYPYFIDKIIDWSEVGNIILKDDVLTIDLKNNTLLQSTVMAMDGTLNESAFNEYCSGQLKKSDQGKLLNENP